MIRCEGIFFVAMIVRPLCIREVRLRVSKFIHLWLAVGLRTQSPRHQTLKTKREVVLCGFMSQANVSLLCIEGANYTGLGG